ncbi:MAG: hypothetical protein OJF49_001563 [Ktedonobacterales bacterium]|nr:MAG: hypothetical protein OJF49_001563 [Ktedonobacterales bacterium]
MGLRLPAVAAGVAKNGLELPFIFYHIMSGFAGSERASNGYIPILLPTRENGVSADLIRHDPYSPLIATLWR